MIPNAIFVFTLVQGALLVLAILFVAWLLFLALPGLFHGPPYVGTSTARLVTMLELAELKPGMHVVDMGSGDGRLLLAAAQAGAQAQGYELNLFLVWRTRLSAMVRGLSSHVTVRWGNFWKADLAQADAVFIYGYSTIMDKLEAKLESELKPGACLVSYRYTLPTWPAEISRDHVHRYRKK